MRDTFDNIDYNLSKQSFEDADKELEACAVSYKENIEKINKLSSEILDNLKGNVRNKFCEMQLLMQDSLTESWLSGKVQGYKFIENIIDNGLYKIFLNLIYKGSVSDAEERIKYSFDAAVFNVFICEMMKDNKQKDLIDKYGKDKTYWSRQKDSKAALNFLGFHKAIKSMTADNTQTDEDYSIQDLFKDISVETETLREKSGEKIAKERLNEGAQDFIIAIKIAKEDTMEKAVKFLKGQGHSKKSIEKLMKPAKK